MKRFYFIILVAILCINSSFAQDSIPFKPSGKVIARSFFDYSTGFGHANDERGFDLTRAFLGYSYKFTRTLQGQVIIDGASGKTSTDGLEVYVRNAFINWNDKGFNINVGLTGLLQFSIQEKYWMHRYVMKSFQDLNKMAPSVDMGITAEYAFNPYLSADLSLTNGEGYKKIKKDNSMRYAAGISLYPIKNTIFRIYADIYNDDEKQRDALPEGVTDGNYKDQYTLSLFAGYQNEKISFGAEYNKVYNKGFIEKKDYYGYSFYTSAKLASKCRTFARYDLTDSSNPSAFTSPWNDLDGQLMMVGVEFQPVKQLKIAPNFRNINKDRAKAEQYLFINVEFNL
ncbi:MAG: outer membrane beta-barrel protein [Dysgonomonas sp.]